MTTQQRPVRRRGERAESTVQVLILLAIGTAAAYASFNHVHDVAAHHGQTGWLAWADAVVLELMSIASGLEIRRRHRNRQPAGFVLAILVAAVTLSLSAQVVAAEKSVIGWLAAALPALGFLACVKIVLTRASIETPHTGATTAAVPAIPPSIAAPDLVKRTVPDAPAEPSPVPLRPAALPIGLLDRARDAHAAHLAATGRTITRDELREQLRVSNALAGDVLRALRDAPSREIPINGHQLTSEPR